MKSKGLFAVPITTLLQFPMMIQTHSAILCSNVDNWTSICALSLPALSRCSSHVSWPQAKKSQPLLWVPDQSTSSGNELIHMMFLRWKVEVSWWLVLTLFMQLSGSAYLCKFYTLSCKILIFLAGQRSLSLQLSPKKGCIIRAEQGWRFFSCY